MQPQGPAFRDPSLETVCRANLYEHKEAVHLMRDVLRLSSDMETLAR